MEMFRSWNAVLWFVLGVLVFDLAVVLILAIPALVIVRFLSGH